jgi:hypothetical protein
MPTFQDSVGGEEGRGKHIPKNSADLGRGLILSKSISSGVLLPPPDCEVNCEVDPAHGTPLDAKGGNRCPGSPQRFHAVAC